jgi:RHS repeat-associated protein
VVGNAAILSVFKPPPPRWQVKAFRIDWQPPRGTTLGAHASKLLGPTIYWTSFAYDALNRIKVMHYPQDVSGTRKELRPRYSRAGALESVELDGKAYVERIAYNARGQRMLIAYGNGVMTRHAYDAKTFRSVRMRTERYTKPDGLTYRPTGTPLQDLAYAYDLAGNLLALSDRTPGNGVATKPNALDRAFTYDPLYRLLSATGRECEVPPSPPWSVGPRCSDVTKTRAYTEAYQYDPAGNLKRLQHQAAHDSFTRTIALAPNTNRLAKVTIGAKFWAYAYDPGGNLIREGASRHFEWDHANRMRVYRTQIGDAEPSVHAHYLYDTNGQRVKKVVRKKEQVEVTVYVDGVFEHHQITKAGDVKENYDLHIMDGRSRIAQTRVGEPFTGDATPAVKYHLGDHLGSSNVIVDGKGSWTNREEYTPYGESSFGSFARKRYRFTGKERDEESGLYYHGARYYAPWLARWISPDPILMRHLRGHAQEGGRKLPDTLRDVEETDGTESDVVREQDEDEICLISPYNYSECNPIVNTDPDGNSPVSVVVKQGIKVAAKKAIKEFLENQVKSRLKNYMSKNFAKQFAKDAEAIADTLDSEWWEIGIELVPIAGDVYGAGSFAKKMSMVWDRAKMLEKKVQLVTTAASKAFKKIELSLKLTGKGKDKLSQVADKVNRISEHLTEDDLAGAARDILGDPVVIGGRKYDHLTEVKDALRGLGNQIDMLKEGIRKGEFEGDVLTEANRLFSDLSKHKDQVQNVLKKVEEARH